MARLITRPTAVRIRELALVIIDCYDQMAGADEEKFRLLYTEAKHAQETIDTLLTQGV